MCRDCGTIIWLLIYFTRIIQAFKTPKPKLSRIQGAPKHNFNSTGMGKISLIFLRPFFQPSFQPPTPPLHTDGDPDGISTRVFDYWVSSTSHSSAPVQCRIYCSIGNSGSRGQQEFPPQVVFFFFHARQCRASRYQCSTRGFIGSKKVPKRYGT